jgi:hypothetical protein
MAFRETVKKIAITKLITRAIFVAACTESPAAFTYSFSAEFTNCLGIPDFVFTFFDFDFVAAAKVPSDSLLTNNSGLMNYKIISSGLDPIETLVGLSKSIFTVKLLLS